MPTVMMSVILLVLMVVVTLLVQDCSASETFKKASPLLQYRIQTHNLIFSHFAHVYLTIPIFWRESAFLWSMSYSVYSLAKEK